MEQRSALNIYANNLPKIYRNDSMAGRLGMNAGGSAPDRIFKPGRDIRNR
ncbi:hypothetical protein [Desulfosarcina alkanivorans]|nr:hypothetical protein [Desulfosarcina alkanivorans]